MKETEGSSILVCSGLISPIIRPIELNFDKENDKDRIKVGDYASKGSTNNYLPTVGVSNKPFLIFRGKDGELYRQVGDKVIKIEGRTINSRFEQRGRTYQKEEER